MFKLELLIFKISFIFLSSQIFRLSWLKPEAEVDSQLFFSHVGKQVLGNIFFTCENVMGEVTTQALFFI